MKKKLTLTLIGTLVSMIIACGDESSTAPVVEDVISSEANQSEDSNVDEQPEDSLAQVSSEVETSSSTSTQGITIDDMSGADSYTSNGQGLWFGDDDHTNNGSSEVLDLNGNSLAKSLETQECATAAQTSGDVDEDGVSDCYPGWNLANGDAYASDGALTAELQTTGYVNPTGWGWASAGFVLQFEGGASDKIAQNFSSEDVLEVVLEYPLGETLTLKARETQYVDKDVNSPAKKEITGTGTKTKYSIPMSEFLPASWAENEFNPADVYRLSIAKEVAAAKSGDAFPEDKKGSSLLKIYCVGLNGGC